MKILVVFASYAVVTSAGFVGFSGGNGGNSDIMSYSAPGLSGFGGGYSSDFNSFRNDASFSGGQSSFGTGNSASLGSGGSGFGSGRSVSNGNRGVQSSAQQGGQVRKFISVHVSSEPEVVPTPRIIRAGGPPETHYNIIFVKAPSHQQQKTEVVLPDPPKQKTLVYVLIKRPDENQENVKITKPNPTKPSKPEVYFIRYKPDGDKGNAQGGAAGASLGASNGNRFNSGGFNSNGNDLDSSYGPPSQNGGGSDGGYQ